MIWENLKQAFGSLRSAKLRSFLTMLGIIIGIGAVVAISSIGNGLQKQVTSQVNDLGANLVFVLPGQVISGSGSKQSFNPSASIGTSTLTNKDVSSLKKVQGVNDVAEFSLISGVIKREGTTDPAALLLAVTSSYPKVIESPKVADGRFIQDSDKASYVVVLGSNARDKLFGKGTDAIDKTVSIRGADFKVIGVMEQSSSGGTSLGGPSLDDSVYMSTKAAKALTGTEPSIYRIGVKVDSENDVASTVDRIKAKLKKNHGGQEDYSVLTQKDLLSTVGTILDALTSGVAAIAAIALLVGGIGIMNIMLVAVTERTREIGVRKALGATYMTILAQFLIEAAILSLLGGALGVVEAFGMGKLAGRVTKIPPVFTWQIVGIAVGVSVGVGIIFGLAPAIKAARKRPIEALRYE